ncbi:MAG: NAD(P)H-dependent oxidoreductase subunit E [Myxococcota bacterium]|nr:NAD(P)H-dependent oxidoreductase subunit E [Myxococcota bacterium]
MVISEETRARIDEEKAKYPRERGALLAALHLVHDDHGFVSTDCAAELAEIFSIRPIDVLEVVSFYNMFHATPQPRHHVYVCTNLPCSLRGARTLLRQLEAHLGVHAGEPTSDGRVVLGHEECLGACAYAPMMRVDGEYHEDLDAERAKSILDSLE